MLDCWQNATNVFYAVQQPGMQSPDNLRGIYHSRADGKFEIRTMRPVPYPIPSDGPVGDLLKTNGRNWWRPGHLHIWARHPELQGAHHPRVRRRERLPRRRRRVRCAAEPDPRVHAGRQRRTGDRRSTSCSIGCSSARRARRRPRRPRRSRDPVAEEPPDTPTAPTSLPVDAHRHATGEDGEPRCLREAMHQRRVVGQRGHHVVSRHAVERAHRVCLVERDAGAQTRRSVHADRDDRLARLDRRWRCTRRHPWIVAAAIAASATRCAAPSDNAFIGTTSVSGMGSPPST